MHFYKFAWVDFIGNIFKDPTNIFNINGILTSFGENMPKTRLVNLKVKLSRYI